MKAYDQQSPGQPQPQTGPAAPAPARNNAAADSAPFARPTTQAERAVLHPAPVMGQGDLHDPDWRYYYATGA